VSPGGPNGPCVFLVDISQNLVLLDTSKSHVLHFLHFRISLKYTQQLGPRNIFSGSCDTLILDSDQMGCKFLSIQKLHNEQSQIKLHWKHTIQHKFPVNRCLHSCSVTFWNPGATQQATSLGRLSQIQVSHKIYIVWYLWKTLQNALGYARSFVCPEMWCASCLLSRHSTSTPT
jgi:hypothetical protein